MEGSFPSRVKKAFVIRTLHRGTCYRRGGGGSDIGGEGERGWLDCEPGPLCWGKENGQGFPGGSTTPPLPAGLPLSSIHGLRTAVSGNTKAAKAGQRELLTTHWRLRGAPAAHCPSKGQSQVGEVEGCNGALECSVQNFLRCTHGCIKLYTHTY